MVHGFAQQWSSATVAVTAMPTERATATVTATVTLTSVSETQLHHKVHTPVTPTSLDRDAMGAKHTTGTAYNRYSIQQVQHTTGTAYNRYSIQQVQHTSGIQRRTVARSASHPLQRVCDSEAEDRPHVLSINHPLRARVTSHDGARRRRHTPAPQAGLHATLETHRRR
jgi:hypothetical protein